MKKALILSVMILLALHSVYSQEELTPRQPKPEQMIYLNGGDLLTALGPGAGILINGGYEGFIFDVLSVYGEINAWIMIHTFIGGTVGINIHPIPKFKIDPFIGVGFMYSTDINKNVHYIDVPFNLGANLMVTDFFGFRIQGKLYLLSLKDMYTEINAGVLIKI